MKHKPEIITEALSCRKRGMPYNQVSKHFKEYDRANICSATAYNWVKKYGRVLRDYSTGYSMRDAKAALAIASEYVGKA